MTVAARRALAHHSKSFALAGKLLSGDMLDDAAVLYAWCRRADDAIDLGPEDGAAARLSALRAELALVYAGEVQVDPLLSALQQLARRRAIPECYPRALLDGLETDLGVVRLSTVAELLLYAHRVAGVVGLMMCHVLRSRSLVALRHAVHLGMAMQLTNICRDVAEDWQRGRLYIPGDVLAEAGAPRLGQELGGPLPESSRPALARALRRLLEMADNYYRSGDAGLPALPWRAAFAVRAARLVYAAIGDELARREYDVLRGRATVSRGRKILLIARAALQEISARLRARWRGGSLRAAFAPEALAPEVELQFARGEMDGPLLLDR